MIRPLLIAALIAMATPVSAQSGLAAELKTLARTETGPVSAELMSVSYSDALVLLDQLNHADYRRLSKADEMGRFTLPTGVRQALEVKAPRLNQRGSGR